MVCCGGGCHPCAMKCSTAFCLISSINVVAMGSGGTRVGWKEKEVDSNLKEEVNMVEVDLNLMEVLLSCSFSFLRGKYEILKLGLRSILVHWFAGGCLG